MKKFIALLLAAVGVSVFAQTAVQEMNLAGFHISRNKKWSGVVKKVAKTAKTSAKCNFITEKSDKPAVFQIYGHDPAALSDVKTYTLTYTVSKDASDNGSISFALKTKNKKYSWYGSLRAGIAKSQKLTPGTHTIVTGVDLTTYKLPKLGYICPIITVKGLTSGSVVIESLKVTTVKKKIVAKAAAPVKKQAKPESVLQGPGLAGFTVQKNALPCFEWKKLPTSQRQTMLAYTTQGLNIVELSPANPAVAWQWPQGDTILAEYQPGNKLWWIRSGEQPGKYTGFLVIKGEKITAAAGAEGVIFRDNKKNDRFVYGGVNQRGRTLLVKKGTPPLKVRSIKIADQALSWIVNEEAENALNEAWRLYQENFKYILQNWSGNKRDGQWRALFDFYRENILRTKAQLLKETENYLPVLLNEPSIRDRLSLWVYFAALYPTGAWRNDLFKVFDGQAHVQASLQFARKVDTLVSRARRICRASFTEGVSAKDITLSAGFAESSLTHVFRRAGSPEKLYKEMNLDLGAGETESAQLVLTTGRYGVQDLSVKCTPVSANAPSVRLYLMDYIALMSVPPAQLPLTLGGDFEMPDVLKNYKPGTPFAIESHRNQPVQIDIKSGKKAAPGVYKYRVDVLHKNKIAASLPLTVKIRSFSFGNDYIQSIGGWTNSGFKSWYTKAEDIKAGRRNLITSMLEHRLNPIDLYHFSPVQEDLEWALKQGITAVHLGRNSMESMAHPDPDMLKFLTVYGSADGKKFTKIPAEVKLVPRPLKIAIDEHDLVIKPKTSIAQYKYIKIHNPEVRDWQTAIPIQRYFLMSRLFKTAPVEFTDASGKVSACNKFTAMSRDTAPETNGVDKTREFKEFWLDFRRSGQELRSVIVETNNAELASIRLVNRCIERSYGDIMSKYNLVRSTPGGEKIQIFLYGYDETRSYFNHQVLSSFANCKKVLPKDIKIISTVGEPDREQRIYKYMDIHVPCNGYGFPRNNQRMKKKYGTEYWTYVGGGSYYPFANFERVDQPLIHSRAFCWEMIGFDHIDGMLYWDIHMWRYNKHLKDNHDIDWSLWNPTHNTNNGMGAIFYPGPHGEIYPSRRATALRDGLDDVLAFRIARRLINAKPAAERSKYQTRLMKIRDGYCTGMSVYCKNIKSMNSNRTALYDLIEELNK